MQKEKLLERKKVTLLFKHLPVSLNSLYLGPGKKKSILTVKSYPNSCVVVQWRVSEAEDVFRVREKGS